MLTVARVSTSQLVVARDLSHGVPVAFTEAQARRAAGWPAKDVVVTWSSSLRRMRDRHHSFPYLAPLSLLPLDREDLVDVLLGQLDYTVLLNVSSVTRFLRGRGLIAHEIGPTESASWFLTGGRRHGNVVTTVTVTAQVREMMAIELTTPAYVAKLVHTLLESIADQPNLVNEQTMVAPGDERAVWRASYR